LLPLGPFPAGILDAIAARAEREFHAGTERLAALESPDYAWEQKRGQYSSTVILRRLASPAAAEKTLAVTACDLFIPALSFVYGQAQLNGSLALVSIARLRQEFYGLPADDGLLALRAAKEGVHELGHAYGLVHSLDRSCPMSLSTNISQLDLKGASFCAPCRSLLQENA
jgi:archaemetzincin